MRTPSLSRALIRLLIVLLSIACTACGVDESKGGEEDIVAREPESPALPPADPRRRVLISTDIGGADSDDTQSLIHALLYSDVMRIEGIVASFPHGKAGHAFAVVERYAADYPSLLKHSGSYPAPDELRAVIKQGALEPAESGGTRAPTEGSAHIVATALRAEAQPLFIVVWGSLTDVAQALADAPQIKPHIRVYSVGAWNTEQDPAAREYLENFHRDLVWIESVRTNRGIYSGHEGDKSRYGNVGFVEQVVRPAGSLGDYFYEISEHININRFGLKMGDTPSFLFALHGDFDNPQLDSWGGSFCPRGGTFWGDCPDGPRTVSVHRQEILSDFEARLGRLSPLLPP